MESYNSPEWNDLISSCLKYHHLGPIKRSNLFINGYDPYMDILMTKMQKLPYLRKNALYDHLIKIANFF